MSSFTASEITEQYRAEGNLDGVSAVMRGPRRHAAKMFESRGAEVSFVETPDYDTTAQEVAEGGCDAAGFPEDFNLQSVND